MPLRLEQHLGRENNFNLLRILAAIAVLISHAYPLSRGIGTVEPLERILGMSLGTLAVLTFFAISGYFISQSFHNRSNTLNFAAARILRIYPGLFAVLLLTVFVIGSLFTTLDLNAYLFNRKTLLYIPKNLLLWHLQYGLPGVFQDNPYPDAINGSLWTLVYEICCYALVAAVGVLGLASTRRFIGFAVCYAVFYVSVSLLGSPSDHLGPLLNFHLLSLPFMIGMVLFKFRQFAPLRLSIVGILLAVSALSYETPWFQELFIFSWSYIVFYIGFIKYRPLLSYNQLGDYSYGMYIYAFPVEQIIAHLFKGTTPGIMIAISLPITLLLAILSWHCIEQRSLMQKTTVSAWLRRSMRVPYLGVHPKSLDS